MFNHLLSIGSSLVQIFATKYASEQQATKSLALISSQQNMEEKKQQYRLAELKFQALQQQDNQQFNAKEFELNRRFQAEQAQLSFERQKELQEFIQSVQLAINDKNLDFQRWRFEQEKALQSELAAYNRETQLLVAAYQRETIAKQPEVNKLFETWPLRIVPMQILNHHQENQPSPLRVIIAPPEVDFDKFADRNQTSNEFPKIEKLLAEGLGQFLRQNYPLNSHQRPIEFLDGAWDSKRFHGGSSIKALFGMLKSESVLVLESELNGDYLNLRYGYWAAGQTSYTYESIISEFPYKDIVYESAKNRARKWKTARDKLLEMGKDPSIINELDTYNLTILEEEEVLSEAGIDTSNLPRRYKINNDDFNYLCRYLTIYHCLVAGLWADTHFLIHENTTPLLPKLLSDLAKESNEPQQLIEYVVSFYQQLYKQLENERSAWIPELSLDLANSLSSLQNKTWAKNQMIDSIKSWFKLRGLADEIKEINFKDLIETLKLFLTKTDVQYIQNLNQCLTAIEENISINLIDSCYKRAISNYQQEEYEAALDYFSQVIELNSQLDEAYYHRGLIYHKLTQYQKAIQDYNQALQLNPRLATAYSSRGDVYYKLRDYEKAIANYDEALKIEPSLADVAKNREIVRGVWDELKRRLLEEQERIRQQQKENERLRKQQEEQEFIRKQQEKRENLRKQQEEQESLRKQQEERENIRKQQEQERKRNFKNICLLTTLTESKDWTHSVIISPNGQYIVSGSHDGAIKIYELNTGKLINTLAGHKNYIWSLAISPDGEYIASSSDDYTMKIWELSTGKLINALKADNSIIRSVIFSPDGQYIISGTEDKNIMIWKLNTGKLIKTLTGHYKLVNSVAVSPDQQHIVSGSSDKTIKIWEVDTGKSINTLTKHNDWVNSVIISPNGQYIVSGSRDNTIKIWELTTGQLLNTLTGHQKSVKSVVVSPDGQYIVSCSEDETIKIWELNTGILLKTLTGHSDWVNSVVVSPNQEHIVSASCDNTVNIWRMLV